MRRGTSWKSEENLWSAWGKKGYFLSLSFQRKVLKWCHEENRIHIGLTPELFASSGWHTWLLFTKEALDISQNLTWISLLFAQACRIGVLGLPVGSKFVYRVSDTEIFYRTSTEKILLHRAHCTDVLRQTENTRLIELRLHWGWVFKFKR